jgi:hypothetical protein
VAHKQEYSPEKCYTAATTVVAISQWARQAREFSSSSDSIQLQQYAQNWSWMGFDIILRTGEYIADDDNIKVGQ